MKVLILGANGILGHTLFLYLKGVKSFKIFGICGVKSDLSYFFRKNQSNLTQIDLINFVHLEEFIKVNQPDYIINCAVKKSLNNSDERITNSILVNSILPHRLSFFSLIYKFKLIQFSTDSVFGNFGRDKTEDCSLVIQDLYSASKALGEPINQNTMVLRTSFIGHSLDKGSGLLDWVLNSDNVYGYENHIFAGSTSLELSKIINKILLLSEFHPGIFHISGQEIRKYDLIKLILNTYDLNKLAEKKSGIFIDRAISSSKLIKYVNYKAQSWEKILVELRDFYLRNKEYYE